MHDTLRLAIIACTGHAEGLSQQHRFQTADVWQCQPQLRHLPTGTAGAM
jgi:hypothetical protein